MHSAYYIKPQLNPLCANNIKTQYNWSPYDVYAGVHGRVRVKKIRLGLHFSSLIHVQSKSLIPFSQNAS